MILVDINVPSVDMTWDFMIDENTELRMVIPELVRMAAAETESDETIDPERFSLYSVTDGRELSPFETLAESGIRDGHGLMLL